MGVVAHYVTSHFKWSPESLPGPTKPQVTSNCVQLVHNPLSATELKTALKSFATHMAAKSDMKLWRVVSLFIILIVVVPRYKYISKFTKLYTL